MQCSFQANKTVSSIHIRVCAYLVIVGNAAWQIDIQYASWFGGDFN